MLKKKPGYDIFLGGTTNSNWRNDFIALLKKKNSSMKCFNPVVDTWTNECIELENFVKFHAKYHVYVLTPKMQGVYSIAEMVESVHDCTKKVYIYVQNYDIDNDGNQIKWDMRLLNSLNAVSNLIVSHGGITAKSMEDLIDKIVNDYMSTPMVRKF